MMDATEQVQTAEQFMSGLVESFGLSADVKAELDDDGVLRIVVGNGDGLGQLIGPRLATLDAVQEICRNNLQREAAGREYAKVIVDVGGVRERRRESLAAFVTDAANQVTEDGREVVFEVMSSSDRKVVHDTVAELDGVESGSIGEDPRRRVVIRPSWTIRRARPAETRWQSWIGHPEGVPDAASGPSCWTPSCSGVGIWGSSVRARSGPTCETPGPSSDRSTSRPPCPRRAGPRGARRSSTWVPEAGFRVWSSRCSFPRRRWSLLDGSDRRCAFLDDAVVRLSLSDRVTVACARAETGGS